MSFALFEVIDATGGGCCRVRADEVIELASPNFSRLTGTTEVVGRSPAELLIGLPKLGELPTAVGPDAEVVRVVGIDGVGRELAVARIPDASGDASGLLILVDRSGEARLRRSEARLARQIDDLEAELATREREPRRPRIRSAAELAVRLEEALMRARRYQHHVTLAVVRMVADGPVDQVDSVRRIGEAILGCVRGVDDLGHADDRWILLLPHTELAGGEVVGKRVAARLGALELGEIAIGVAQIGPAEPASAAVERAEQVCAQALEGGGGLLLAVALV